MARAVSPVRAAHDGAGLHLSYLDGVRGVSILLVVLFHERVHLPGHALDPADVIGAYGVDLFFVLSGCCLALPYLTRLHGGASRDFDVATYVARRVLRIVPAFVAATGLLALATWLPWAQARLPGLGAAHPLSLADLLTQLTFFDRDESILVNPSFWSLAVEWRWYALFPLALVLVARTPRLALALALCAAAWTLALGGDPSVDLGMLPAFLGGLFAAGAIVRRGVAPARIAIVLLATLALALALGRGTYFPVQVNPLWQIVAVCFLVLGGADARLRAFLEAGWLRATGRVAYSMYLLHEPVVRCVEAAVAPRFGDAAAMALATVAALASGFGLAHLVELPLQRRATVTRFVAAVRPRIARALATLGMPERFDLVRTPRPQTSSKVAHLPSRAALRAVS